VIYFQVTRQLELEERAFSLSEALSAREAFVTSASSLVTAVVEIDGMPISDGRPGPLARELRQLYIEAARVDSA
jgi:D-alanine transaminase